MTDIETRLRHELKCEAERLQPEFLRPLRPPPVGLPSARRSTGRPAADQSSARMGSARMGSPRMGSAQVGSARVAARVASRLRAAGQRPAAPVRRWLASAGAVAAVAVLAGLVLAGRSANGGVSIRDEFQGATAPTPRFYVALTGQQPVERAVVHDSQSGQVLSSAPVSAVIQDTAHFKLHAAAAGDDRTFAIVAENGIGHQHPALRVLMLRVGPDGRTSSTRLLPGRFAVRDPADYVTGVALSADGTSLAAAFATAGAPRRSSRGFVETVSLRTGTVRTWGAVNEAVIDPSWVNGSRYLSFVSLPRQRADVQVRLLDTAAPGQSLLASRVLAMSVKSPAISSALVSPDGETILATTYRNVGDGHGRGRAIDQIVSLSAETGQVISRLPPVRFRYRGVPQMTAADLGCQVLSLAGAAGAGQALVQCPRLARLSGGRLTQLPQAPTPAAVTW